MFDPDAPQTPGACFSLGAPPVAVKSPSGHNLDYGSSGGRFGRPHARRRGRPVLANQSHPNPQAPECPQGTPVFDLSPAAGGPSWGQATWYTFGSAGNAAANEGPGALGPDSPWPLHSLHAPSQGLGQQQLGDGLGTSLDRAGAPWRPAEAVPDGLLDPLSELIQLLLLPDGSGLDGGAGPRDTEARGAAQAAPMERAAAEPGRQPSLSDAGVGSGHAQASGGVMDLHALAAALDEVDASLDWAAVGPPPGLLDSLAEAAAVDADSNDNLRGNDPASRDPADRSGAGSEVALGSAQREGDGGQGPRRPRLTVRRTPAGSPGGLGSAAQRDSPTHGDAGGRLGSWAHPGAAPSSCWQVMIMAPSPHNPEALATLLLAGRLVNPHTAVPAPLLANAAAEHNRRQSAASKGVADASNAEDTHGLSSAGQRREPGLGRVGLGLCEGPAVALVRCKSAYDAAAALALADRRVYCPPLVEGGLASWRPLTVVVQSAPGGAAGSPPRLPGTSEERPQSRLREKGPSVRRVVMSGLPGHMGPDDLTALFGSGLQLPGHSARPQDRRFLLLCPDAVSFSSLLAWSGTRLPDKPLDALHQIVPRVADWTTLRVEEDDGLELPGLIAELRAAARRGCGPAAAASRRPPWPPRVAGRFHPAELDEMDEAAAEAEAASGSSTIQPQTADSSGPASSQGANAAAGTASDGPGTKHPAAVSTTRARAAALPARGRVAAGEQGVDDAAAAAAAVAERAESSRGASSSGLQARPAPRPRRDGGQFAASVGGRAGGGFFGPGDQGSGTGGPAAARCVCCPPGGFGSLSGMGFPRGGGGGAGGDVGGTGLHRGGGGGGASSAGAAVNAGGDDSVSASWSGEAAVDLLNKLLALGIDGGFGEDGLPGQETEDEHAPFFRRSRKRMPAHFGRKPEDEEGDGEEDGEEEDSVVDVVPLAPEAAGLTGAAASGGTGELPAARVGSGRVAASTGDDERAGDAEASGPL